MTAASTTAHVRLAVLAGIALLLAFLACRPAWSPDGRKLLFHTRTGKDQLAIALYDRDTGRAETIFATTPKTIVEPLWTADGKHAVLVCGQRESKAWRIVLQPIPTSSAPVTFVIDTRGDPGDSLIVPPVVLGRSLFLAQNGIQRIDLDTGKVTGHAPVADGEQIVVAKAGKGLGYVKGKKGKQADHDKTEAWEIGLLDPDTMLPTPLLQNDPDLRWEVQPVPAFSPDRSRIALPAHADTEPKAAILVFANGKLETTLPIDGDAQFGSIAWAANGALLYASGCRRSAEDKSCHWFLLETTIGGSVAREIPIVDTPDGSGGMSPVALAFQLALSPDGKTAALSTAMLDHLDDGKHGLYLVDLAHKQRPVTRVPFPAVPRGLTLGGSDVMLQLAEAWADGYVPAPHSQPITVLGGGTGTGMKQLLARELDLAMATRPARPQELAAAQKLGTTLVEHRVAFDALAIYVHKDNPITAITMEQLKEVFGAGGKVANWSDLGVKLAEGETDKVVMASRQNNSGTYEYFREAVLGGGQGRFKPQCNHLNGSKEVVDFCSKTKTAIGYSDISYATAQVRVVPVVGKAGQPVMPTKDTVRDGTYPLARPMFLYTLGEPRPPVAAFLQWLQSDAGRQATLRSGFQPGN